MRKVTISDASSQNPRGQPLTVTAYKYKNTKYNINVFIFFKIICIVFCIVLYLNTIQYKNTIQKYIVFMLIKKN